MDTTGPYGDPPLTLACYFRTIRWHDNQTCQPCHHQSPSLRAFCKALASMVGGLFSWVLLRSASLRRRQVGCPPWHPDQDTGGEPIALLLKAGVCKSSTGRWDILRCSVLICHLNHSSCGHPHGCPITMTHIQGNVSSVKKGSWSQLGQMVQCSARKPKESG